MLAEQLDVRLSSPINHIDKKSGKYEILGESFDKVVLSAPFPQMLPLAASAGEGRHVSNFSYRCCLAIALGYASPAPDVPYFALLALDRMTPVLWVGIESLKVAGRAPDGHSVFVVQLGPEYSRANFEAPEAVVTAVAAAAISRLFGNGFAVPEWSHLTRWEYSQPERVALFDSVNRDRKNLVICGDGTLAGRAENAFESGVLAAKMLLNGASNRV
jgi:predicted NAD/FAD-dependent oxidoreductase